MIPDSISIGRRLIGDGHPSFLIAEIGSNHNHDFDLARRMIDAAAAARVDAVKFQTFRASEHYSRFTPGFSYLDDGNTFELIQSLELDRSWQEPLMRHAEGAGVEFFSSPCDSAAIRELAALNVPAMKVASFDLTDQTLIGEMAQTMKPMILSTGMASQLEITAALSACRNAGNDHIVLLQCTSLYPAPAHLSNLKAMSEMRETFSVHVGYSDHTTGDHVAIAAVAMGARVIEKHFTIDRSLPGPDHSFAIEPAELEQMVRSIREVEDAFGDGRKDGPRAEEREMYDKGRRSLHASTDIEAGEIITAEKVIAKRPGLGISPLDIASLVGKRATTCIKRDQWITWDMV